MREALDLVAHGAQHREAIGLAPSAGASGTALQGTARCIPRCFSLTTAEGEGLLTQECHWWGASLLKSVEGSVSKVR